MTFYQELQLNQAGSKNLLKKSETVKEKSYHILVYLVKIAVTMAFCSGRSDIKFLYQIFQISFISSVFMISIKYEAGKCCT